MNKEIEYLLIRRFAEGEVSLIDMIHYAYECGKSENKKEVIE